GRPGNPGETLRRRRAGAVLRVPAAGLGARPRADARAGTAGRGRRGRARPGLRRRESGAMSSVPGRGAGILAAMRGGLAAPLVVLALLALVVVPLSPVLLVRKARVAG